MVEIDHKIIIAGIICLSTIFIIQMILDHDNSTIAMMIVGTIALAIGVVIPIPKIDNKRGVLRW